MDEPLDRLTKSDERADEDREHDREPGPPLTARAPEVEGDPERHRGERVSEVVDQVGEQRDAQRP